MKHPERHLLLRSTLRENFSEQYINRFEGYRMSDDDMKVLTDSAKILLEKIPIRTHNSFLLSPLWASLIQQKTRIPLAVVYGDLEYNEKKLFVCTRPLGPAADTESALISGGHCWIEIGGQIADFSLFRTIYYGNLQEHIRKPLIEQFGEGRGPMIAKPELFNKKGLNYAPSYSLSLKQTERFSQGHLNLSNIQEELL